MGIDAGDEIFSPRMKAVILRSFVIKRRWADLTRNTRHQYRCRVYRDLECEQALRWSVIFRKITNDFRSDSGRDVFAYVRSVVNTGKRQGLSMLDSILIALDPLKSLFSLG